MLMLDIAVVDLRCAWPSWTSVPIARRSAVDRRRLHARARLDRACRGGLADRLGRRRAVHVRHSPLPWPPPRARWRPTSPRSTAHRPGHRRRRDVRGVACRCWPTPTPPSKERAGALSNTSELAARRWYVDNTYCSGRRRAPSRRDGVGEQRQRHREHHGGADALHGAGDVEGGDVRGQRTGGGGQGEQGDAEREHAPAARGDRPGRPRRGPSRRARACRRRRSTADPARSVRRSAAMRESAVLTTAMSSMSIAVAAQTTASVQRLTEGERSDEGMMGLPLRRAR